MSAVLPNEHAAVELTDARVLQDRLEAIVSARDLARRYGVGRHRRRRPARRLARRAAGRARRRHGPVGLGQVDARCTCSPASTSRPSGTVEIAGNDITTMSRQRADEAAPRAHRLRLPVLQPAADADRRGERDAAAADRRQEGRRGVARAACSTQVGLADRRAHRPRSSPAASSSASRSPARSSRSRRCCSPTSRPATSTRRRRPRSSSCCARRSRATARRRSWSPTTRRRRRSPTASSSSPTAPVVRELGSSSPSEVLDALREVTPAVTSVALKGLLGAQAARRADGARDRARRRDGERLVRAHRLDPEGVPHALLARRTRTPTP